ncbi:GerAB/ArcD/ProY family transporter [Bacillus spongiae]|uniref:GerAB/ArcD/ProY family transporter n=1 Tax=Bacillus spongiae TaxID=2683610 RepID=A0ABU8HIB9_9BACI
MEVNVYPKKNLMISAFLVMFIVHTVQAGVGAVGLPRIIFLEVEQDAWISVLLSGFVTCLSVLVIYLTLAKYESADLYGIQRDIYGKWIGAIFNSIYIGYLLLGFFTIAMDYTEMVQAWIFPLMPTWLLMGLLITLTIYAVMGGLRVITGIAFLSFVLSVWITSFIYAPIREIIWTHYFPIWDHSMKEFSTGIIKTSLSVIGFEMLFFVYPFVIDKKKTLKYSLIAVIFTTFLYTIVTFVSIGFFSYNGLREAIWPVLSMFKIVRIPNLERFEFIAVSFWMFIILPNLCFYFWAATRGLKRVYKINQRLGSYIFGIILWSCTFLITSRIELNTVSDITGKIGLALITVYPFILFALVLVKKKLLKR